LSAGTRSAVWPTIAKPDVLDLLDEAVDGEVDAEARDRLELVERAARCAEPRPLIFPTGTPQAATIGPTAIVVLSPTPPVECLSTTFRPERGAEVERAAAADHRVGERERLGGGHAAEVDEPCRTRPAE
jgi:hypothetical protein